MKKIATAFELIERFYEFGFEAYLVGGSVRDLLMNRPIKDIDITTNALPIQIEEIANKLGLKYIETGIEHGTITIIYNNIPMEITTFRIDKGCDGRHCDVEFVKTLEEDLSRRDFTINAIAIDKDGNYIDLFNGQEDIKNRIIRAIGNPIKRFAEDKLRLLRGIRFATTLNFIIEEDTYELMNDFVGKLKFNSIHEIIEDDSFYSINSKPISYERIRDELTKIIMSQYRIRGIELLDKKGFLSEILPEISLLKGVNQSELHHPEKDVYVHTLLSLESINDNENASLELILSILLHDIGKPLTRSFESETEIHFYEHEKYGAEIAEVILKRLKFPKFTIDKVKWLIANHMRIHHFNEMKKSKKVALIEHEYFTDLIELAIADIKGSSGINNSECEDFNVIYEIGKFVKDYNKEKENRPVLKQKLVNGFDIMNLGVSKKEGIKVGKILEQVNDAVIEGFINTKEEALEFAKKMI